MVAEQSGKPPVVDDHHPSRGIMGRSKARGRSDWILVYGVQFGYGAFAPIIIRWPKARDEFLVFAAP